MANAMPKNSEIRQISEEYFAQQSTPVTRQYLDQFVIDVRQKMLTLSNVNGRDSVREAIAAVLSTRQLKACLADVDEQR